MLTQVLVTLLLYPANDVTSQLRARILEEGDNCLTPSEKSPKWVCKPFKNCPVALRLIKENKPPPARLTCGFKVTEPVVCCPPYEISDWSGTEILSGQNATPEEYVDNPKISTIPSKATAKCNEYRQFYRKNHTKAEIKPGTFGIMVTGGEDAKPKEFLHMGLLGYGTPPSYLCGGSLISERFVLSAAHCAKTEHLGSVRTVILGDLDTESHIDDAAPRTYFVAGIYIHESYEPDSLYHDIMLLELDEDVNFNSYIKPVCLHPTKYIPADTAIVTGWGFIEPDGPQSRILQKAELPFVGPKKCNESFRNYAGSQQLQFGIMDNTQICAGAQGLIDACKGDSGGPLQILKGDGVFEQVGVVSFGKSECGAVGAPVVFTRVSAYIDWIESIVWP